MITIACPWCDEDVALPAAELALEPAYICPGCATSVALIEEPVQAVVVAA